jgi:hypothetical protein
MPFVFHMANNAVEIGAMLDVGELQAGFDQATQTTEQATQRSTIQFKEASTASTRRHSPDLRRAQNRWRQASAQISSA